MIDTNNTGDKTLSVAAWVCSTVSAVIAERPSTYVASTAVDI